MVMFFRLKTKYVSALQKYLVDFAATEKIVFRKKRTLAGNIAKKFKNPRLRGFLF